ncbi:MAG: DUF2029 domain-containing protein [Myxococcales bacterium]|nr:DUF2029 domain-containing protein [Myxococcales bacterium]
MRGGALGIFIGLLVLPTAALLLLWPVHGLNTHYYAIRDEQPVFCATAVSTDLFYSETGLFQSPCRYAWNSKLHGDNDKVPELAAEWAGYLRVPHAGSYYFASKSPGDFSLDLGPHRITLSPDEPAARPLYLTAGLYRLNAHYRGENGPMLTWNRSAGNQRPIDLRYFYRRPPAPLATTLAVLSFVALFFAEFYFLARLAPARAAALGDFVWRRRYGLALVFLLALVLATRLYQYDRMPFAGESGDEYNVALNGLNLVYTGVPSSWSILKAYQPAQREKQPIFGRNFSIVRPFFDHPPGHSLLTGVWLRIMGVGYDERYEHYFENKARLVPIVATVFNALLLFFLAWRVCGRRDLALLAVLVFALYPPAMFSGRLSKEENFLITFFLLALLGVENYLSTGKPSRLLLAAVAAGAACLFKVSGLAVVGGAAGVLIAARRWRAALWVGAIGAVFFGLYFAYGAYYDWSTFLRVFAGQANRQFSKVGGSSLSTQGLWALLTYSAPVRKNFFSLTHLWFWLGLFFFWREQSKLPEDRRWRVDLVVWPALIYLAFMAITISSDLPYGWYRIPFLPFFAIAAAWYLDRLLREGQTPPAVLFCLLPLNDALYWGWLAPATHHRLTYRLANLVPVGLLVLAQLLPPRYRPAAVKVVSWVAVGAVCILTIVSLFRRWYLYDLEY